MSNRRRSLASTRVHREQLRRALGDMLPLSAIQNIAGGARPTLMKHIREGYLKAEQRPYRGKMIWCAKPKDVDKYAAIAPSLRERLPSTTQASAAPSGYLTLQDIADRIGLKKTYCYAQFRAGVLPGRYSADRMAVIVSEEDASRFEAMHPRHDECWITVAEAGSQYGVDADAIHYAIRAGIIGWKKTRRRGKFSKLVHKSEIKWLAGLDWHDRRALSALTQLREVAGTLEGMKDGE